MAKQTGLIGGIVLGVVAIASFFGFLFTKPPSDKKIKEAQDKGYKGK